MHYSIPRIDERTLTCFMVLIAAFAMSGATQSPLSAHDTPAVGATAPVGFAPDHARSQNSASGVDPPQISDVMNAASFTSKLARGSLATIFGNNYTSGAPVSASTMPLPMSLANVSVRVGGIAAPIFYVASSQINFQVPFEVPAGNSAKVVVTSNGSASAPFSVAMADYAVGVFTYAERDPVVVHATTNAMVTPTDPALPNESIVVYGTGIGKLHNAPRTGYAAGNATAVDSPTVTVGGASARVISAGLTQGFVGMAQFDIQMPATIASGSLPLVIMFPGDVSPSVNLDVQGNLQGAPKLSLSTTNLAFGNVNVGQTKDLSLTLSNTGSAALTISSLKVSGTGFTLVSAPGPLTVSPGKAQTVTLGFAPASPGSESGELTIASNDPNHPSITVSMTAVGVTVNPVPFITGLSPASAPAGSAPLTLTINGNGFVPASSVLFHGVLHKASFDSNGRLSITLSSSDLLVAGSFAVTVNNPSPGGGTSNAVNFSVTAVQASVAGTWQGTWTSTNGSSGAIGANFAQAGNKITGTLLLTGSNCFAMGTATGTISANTISFGLVFSGGGQISFTGTVNTSNSSAKGQYSVQSGACAGDHGAFSFAKQTVQVSVTGKWQGAWLSVTGSGGSLSVSFTQNGGQLTGTLSITGTPCFSNGSISGDIIADTISLGSAFGAGQVSFNGTVNSSGGSFQGQYAVVGGGCSGDYGSFSVTRVN